MIHFPILRSGKLTVQLREISIGESIALAAMPVHMEEASVNAFLRFANTRKEDDPAAWTVPERMLAVCHYLASTADDGPDFAIGEGRYSDYLDAARHRDDAPVDLGELLGDHWQAIHLTGGMAESIERLTGEADAMAGRLHWLVGTMAAQLRRGGETAPDAATEPAEFDRWMVPRMKILSAFPESDFMALMTRFMDARTRLQHLFRLDISDTGFIALPHKGAAADLPPARFPVHTCLGPLARAMVGKPDPIGA